MRTKASSFEKPTRALRPAWLACLVVAAAGSAQAATTIVSWGDGASGQTQVPPGLTGVTAVATHGDHSLALGADGHVAAWGLNRSGQTNVPAGLSHVLAVAAGDASSLALREDGTVVAWGGNGSGQCAIPLGLNHVAAIGAGWGHSLALRQDGTVVAWGYNYDHQAQVPPGLYGVQAVAGGAAHTLALKNNGTVASWGDHTFGQLNAPSGLSGVEAIAAGSYHSLALRSDGTVVGWGRNDFGEALAPADLTNAVAVAAGDGYSMALRADGKVVFWGYDHFGLAAPVQGLSNVVAIAAGTSHGVALLSDGAPFVVRQPRSQTVADGAAASFHAAVVGEPPLHFQWQLEDHDIPDATNSTLVLPAVAVADAGVYRLVVTNLCGSTTTVGIPLAVAAPAGVPFMLTQPCDAEVVSGSSAVFAAEAGGTPPLSYHWFFNRTNAVNGGTNAALIQPNCAQELAGVYSLTVSNAFGRVTSAEVSLSLSTNLAWSFQTGGAVFSSPAIAEDGTLYIGSGDGTVYARKPGGTPKWTFVTGGEIQSSPAIARDGTVYVGSGDGYLYAIEPGGTQRWRFQTGNTILSSPTIAADGTIYINSRDGRLYAINPDGTKAWEVASGEYYNDMPAVIGSDSTLYLGVGGKVRAVSRKGRVLWEQAAGGWQYGGVSVVVGPQGVVYATSSGDDMKMVALTHDGELLWEFPFGASQAATAPSYPAIGSDGTLYIASSDSWLYAIRPDGSQKWKVPATRVQSSVALSNDGRIYLNSDWDFRLLCYDTNGVLQWEQLLGGGGASGLSSSFPTLQGGVLYFGSGNGQVYAFNVSGELAGGGWPAFGHDARHSGRDLQLGIEAVVSPEAPNGELTFVVEPNRHYRVQGSTNFTVWVDCTTLQGTNAIVTLPRPSTYSFFRLVSP